MIKNIYFDNVETVRQNLNNAIVILEEEEEKENLVGFCILALYKNNEVLTGYHNLNFSEKCILKSQMDYDIICQVINSNQN